MSARETFEQVFNYYYDYVWDNEEKVMFYNTYARFHEKPQLKPIEDLRYFLDQNFDDCKPSELMRYVGSYKSDAEYYMFDMEKGGIVTINIMDIFTERVAIRKDMFDYCDIVDLCLKVEELNDELNSYSKNKKSVYDRLADYYYAPMYGKNGELYEACTKIDEYLHVHYC